MSKKSVDVSSSVDRMRADFKSEYDARSEDLSPPFNLYTGRDTSGFALFCSEPSLTDQSHAQEADINHIMKTILRTGMVPTPKREPIQFVDAFDVPDFAGMQNIIVEADRTFMALPSDVRLRFGNDPAEFLKFAENEDNRPQLREWGMLSPEAVERLDAAEAAKWAAKAAPAPSAAGKAAGSDSKSAEPPAHS